jgi:O-antigen ligase
VKALALLVVLGVCFVSTVWAPAAAALMLSVFAFKQVCQAYFEPLRASGVGLLVNLGVGVVCVMAAFRRRPNSEEGQLPFRISNAAWFCFVGLLMWGALTSIWSPGREQAWAMIANSTPYAILIFFIGPKLLRSVDDVSGYIYATMLIGIFINATFILSPEFVIKDGRLVLLLSEGVTSSPLSMASFAAWTVIMGGLERSRSGPVGYGLRIASILMGIAVIVLSGSRGQLLAAVVCTFLFLPLAAPGRSGVNRFGSIAALLCIAIAFYFLFNVIIDSLPRFAADRFGAEAMLYSQSSATSRLSGIWALANAWLSSPLAVVIGLGYQAYGTVPGAMAEEVYVHNTYAEALFELGLPGLSLMLGGLFYGWRSAIRNFLAAKTPSARSATAITMSIMLFECLLMAKQGTLWGVSCFMYFASVSGSIERSRESDLVFTESPSTPVDADSNVDR